MPGQRYVPESNSDKTICFAENKERLLQTLLIISGFIISTSIDESLFESFSKYHYGIYLMIIMCFLMSALFAYSMNAITFVTDIEDVNKVSYLIGISFSTLLFFFFFIKNTTMIKEIMIILQFMFGFLIYLALYVPDDEKKAKMILKPVLDNCQESRVGKIKLIRNLLLNGIKTDKSFTVTYFMITLIFYYYN